MTVRETELPGVGKRFDVDVGDGAEVAIVIHNTGRRELYRRAAEDEDAEKLLDLNDQTARTIGTILEGAYFQPVPSEEIEARIGDDAIIEWTTVEADSPLADRTLEDADVRDQTGVSVIAIQRSGETIANPGPETVIEPEDTLVTIGTREDHKQFEEYAADS